jgi:hypothetical protein
MLFWKRRLAWHPYSVVDSTPSGVGRRPLRLTLAADGRRRGPEQRRVQRAGRVVEWYSRNLSARESEQLRLPPGCRCSDRARALAIDPVVQRTSQRRSLWPDWCTASSSICRYRRGSRGWARAGDGRAAVRGRAAIQDLRTWRATTRCASGAIVFAGVVGGLVIGAGVVLGRNSETGPAFVVLGVVARSWSCKTSGDSPRSPAAGREPSG